MTLIDCKVRISILICLLLKSEAHRPLDKEAVEGFAVTTFGHLRLQTPQENFAPAMHDGNLWNTSRSSAAHLGSEIPPSELLRSSLVNLTSSMVAQLAAGSDRKLSFETTSVHGHQKQAATIRASPARAAAKSASLAEILESRSANFSALLERLNDRIHSFEKGMRLPIEFPIDKHKLPGWIENLSGTVDNNVKSSLIALRSMLLDGNSKPLTTTQELKDRAKLILRHFEDHLLGPDVSLLQEHERPSARLDDDEDEDDAGDSEDDDGEEVVDMADDQLASTKRSGVVERNSSSLLQSEILWCSNYHLICDKNEFGQEMRWKISRKQSGLARFGKVGLVLASFAFPLAGFALLGGVIMGSLLAHTAAGRVASKVLGWTKYNQVCPQVRFNSRITGHFWNTRGSWFKTKKYGEEGPGDKKSKDAIGREKQKPQSLTLGQLNAATLVRLANEIGKAEMGQQPNLIWMINHLQGLLACSVFPYRSDHYGTLIEDTGLWPFSKFESIKQGKYFAIRECGGLLCGGKDKAKEDSRFFAGWKGRR